MSKRFLALAAFLLSSPLSFSQVPAGAIRIHYYRPDGNYNPWTIYAFDDTTEDTGAYGSGPVTESGTDAFGAYYDVGVTSGAQNVGLIIHDPTAPGGDIKDPGPNEFVDPTTQGNEFWAISGINQMYTSQPVVSQEPGKLLPNYVRIHYYRPDGQYANWSVYSWNSSAEPNDYNDGPKFATATDSYGAFFDISVLPNPTDVGFIVHNTNTGTKDPGPDMHLNAGQYDEAWVISGDPTVYTAQPGPGQILASGFSRLQAYWIDRQTVAIQPQYYSGSWNYALVASPNASLQITQNDTLTGATTTIPLTLSATGFTPAQAQQYPQLSGYKVFQIGGNVPVNKLKRILTGQLALAATDSTGALKYLTGIQTAGVLDDLFYYSGSLGATFDCGSVTVSVWAPTAQSVKLLLFNNASNANPAATVAMKESNGVWTAQGASDWRGKYYLYSVQVYVPSLHQIVTNIVTDPYSADLALNGTKTRLTDLQSEETKPEGWDWHQSPPLQSKSDFSVYELHVRDFSTADESVPADHRGMYLAFSDLNSNGMRHLHSLAEAGLKAVHLLPTFHFASVNEDKSTWQSPGDLSGYPPDSEIQQEKMAAVQTADDYNWGYDPVHYFAPDGAYAVNPDHRVIEYRQMVMGLHGTGLRVVQDQVFNHTVASGQTTNSVLDEIVPTYYYRLDADGNVENGSCCADTASEHKMMEKLMIDAVVQNAREYKIDGFRFDLMSFHFVYNMEHIQNALNQLTFEKDGVDGSKIYMYGEGWETGETANDALGPNASQVNMYGTGIGTFNDRIRDGIRGGGPFSDQRVQGFATGLFTDPSAYTNTQQGASDQQAQLLLEGDWIRAGLAGNMRDFTFEDASGQIVKASQVNYNGQEVGYTASPIEDVNYCSVHDNQTLFDAIQLKAAIPATNGSGGDSIDVRARRQAFAMSFVALGQGIPFFLAGDDLLRSKDMDNNSYDSNDWFNKIDFTYKSANWGIGLPIASQNQSNWPIMQPLLANPALNPGEKQIRYAREVFQEFLRIRESSRLFRMETLAEVQNNLHFLNTGPSQVPGLIVMTLDANSGWYGRYQHIAVFFNGTNQSVTFQHNALKGIKWFLHPEQQFSEDTAVRGSLLNGKTGSATVPALTTAVFVSEY